MRDATVIILAGGKSSRMGTNKALLEIDGVTVIEKIVNECKKITDNIILVTNTFSDYEFLQVPMVADKVTGKGPLAGMQAGLSASSTKKNLLVACDMPFVSAELGKQLLSNLANFDVAIPEIAGQAHPLFAAYRRECLKYITDSLDNNKLRIWHFLDKVKVRLVKEEDLKNYLESAFFNMNHPEEYDQAKEMAKHDKEGRE